MVEILEPSADNLASMVLNSNELDLQEKHSRAVELRRISPPL
jgi:hypothetical protein